MVIVIFKITKISTMRKILLSGMVFLAVAAQAQTQNTLRPLTHQELQQRRNRDGVRMGELVKKEPVKAETKENKTTAVAKPAAKK